MDPSESWNPGPPPDLRIGEARGQSFEMVVDGLTIPLDVTFLPVDQNMRRVQEAALVRDDIANFLRRQTAR